MPIPPRPLTFMSTSTTEQEQIMVTTPTTSSTTTASAVADPFGAALAEAWSIR